MRRVLAVSLAAGARGERPHGALATDGESVVVAHDASHSLADPTAHAIARALAALASVRQRWRLDGVTVVATHEPCLMCAGALVAARVDRLIFGTGVPDGAAGSRYNVCADPRLGHEVEVISGVLASECAALDLVAHARDARVDSGAPPDLDGAVSGERDDDPLVP